MELRRLNQTLQQRYGLSGDLSQQAAQAERRGLFEPRVRARLRFVARMASLRGSALGLSEVELEQAARQTLAECGASQPEKRILWVAAFGFILFALGSFSLPGALLTGLFATFLYLTRDHESWFLRVVTALVSVLGVLLLASSLLALLGLVLVAVGMWKGATVFHHKIVAAIAAGTLLLVTVLLPIL